MVLVVAGRCPSVLADGRTGLGLGAWDGKREASWWLAGRPAAGFLEAGRRRRAERQSRRSGAAAVGGGQAAHLGVGGRARPGGRGRQLERSGLEAADLARIEK